MYIPQNGTGFARGGVICENTNFTLKIAWTTLVPSGCSCGTAVVAAAAEGGEDAYFVLENDLGVFDGVGGWGAIGYDPGVFTRGFAQAVAGTSIYSNYIAPCPTPSARQGGR